jgi:chromosome partitioning protein
VKTITISNQRGGIGKTTTTLTLARCMAEDGKRVLIIDTDPQGSIYITLDIQDRVKTWLHQFIDDRLSLNEAVTPVRENIDVVASDRRTVRVEGILNSMPAGREQIFDSLLAGAEDRYDFILFDVAPSISSLQTCAIAYTRNVLCPVGMDHLSIEGAMASLQVIELLNKWQSRNCRCIGFLPTMVDRRYSVTDMVLRTLDYESKNREIPVLHSIRTDQSINRASSQHVFLHDWEPKSKAVEDYETVYKQLVEHFSAADNQLTASLNGATR